MSNHLVPAALRANWRATSSRTTLWTWFFQDLPTKPSHNDTYEKRRKMRMTASAAGSVGATSPASTPATFAMAIACCATSSTRFE